MDSNPSDWGMRAAAEEDLEYDLAHEAATAAAQAQVHRSVDTHGGSDEDDTDGAQLTYVSTETPEYSGDYSYDLSHDVPGR